MPVESEADNASARRRTTLTPNARTTLRALGDQSSATDLLREMLEFPAAHWLALEVEGLTGSRPATAPATGPGDVCRHG